MNGDFSTYREMLKDSARDLIAAGFRITVSEGKNPGGAMGDGWHRQTLTAEQAEQLIDRAEHPTLGIIHGPGGSIVFDVDSESELRALMALFDQTPPVMAIDSTGRGEHRHAAFDERLASTNAGTIAYKSPAGDKITVRIGANGKGAHSVIAPSRHAVEEPKGSGAWVWTGKQYAWRADCDLQTIGLAALPDVVVDRLLAAHAAKHAAPRNGAPAGVRGDVLAAMRRATKAMSDGQDGTKRLFTCCCRGVELDATDAEIVACIRAIEAKAPFPKSFSDAEIVNRIRDAESKVQRGSGIIIANFEEIEIEAESLMSDGSDRDPTAEKETETITAPLSMGEIIENINRLTGNWPRRVDNMLFVDDPQHGLGYFDRRSTAALFGWLRRRATVKWLKGGAYVAQAELFAEIERTAQRYDSIELVPHEPMIEGLYYRGEAPEPGDGRHLRWLLDRFCPETTVDRDLLQAAVMTLFWGGPPGCRPAFAFTADEGRGVGKTACATLLARVAGGCIDVSSNEDSDKLLTRLLTPSARTRRVAIWDNVKSFNLSWEKIEALITAPAISGRQLYVGDASRPNLLTWFLTLNGPSMSTDMAQRCVIIRLVRAKNTGAWLEETGAYIDQHRDKIIGDVIAALREPRFELASYTRWATWERDVLSRLAEPGEAQRVITERQGEVNADEGVASIVEDYFANQLERLDYSPHTAQVRIPSAVAARWFAWAMNDRIPAPTASKRLHQMAKEHQLKRLAPEAGRAHGRSFVWSGPGADVFGGRIATDLMERLAARRQDAEDG